MTNSKTKVNKVDSKSITKQQLQELYFDKIMTLDQIGRHFGYCDRQPIMRLFKKYGITSRNRKDQDDIRRNSRVIPSKETLVSMIEGESVLSASKKHNIPRGRLIKYLSYYGIESQYFVNDGKKEIILDSNYDDCSPIEISIMTKSSVSLVKYYRKTFKEKLYNKEDILKKIEKYGYDVNNQNFTGKIKADDESLYNSILYHTKDHNLSSNKLTERIYRIAHEFDQMKMVCCKHCSDVLKFYTFEKGYGNSEIKICKNCLNTHCGFGVSVVSQKLFNELYNNLSSKHRELCKYHDLNGEMVFSIDRSDADMLHKHKDHLNKHRYLFDFVCEDKIIEFDGTYYHKDELKDDAKDAFAELRGYKILHIKELDYYKNPIGELNKCLSFLNQ